MFCARSFTIPRVRANVVATEKECSGLCSGTGSEVLGLEPCTHVPPTGTHGRVRRKRRGSGNDRIGQPAMEASLCLQCEHDSTASGRSGASEVDAAVVTADTASSRLGRLFQPGDSHGSCDLTYAAIRENTAHWDEVCGSKKQWFLDLLLEPQLPLPQPTETPPEACPMSSRSLSIGSVPSLDESCSTSDESTTILPQVVKTSSSRRRVSRPLEASCNVGDDHPLFDARLDLDELDFRVFGGSSPDRVAESPTVPDGALPKSAFKAHLLNSLRALKTAATAISGLASPVLMPEDFLTRSMVTIDPRLPFTDERRPHLDRERPSAALRRYLNPQVTAQLDQRPGILMGSKIPYTKCSTSIQLRTYKVQRSHASTRGGPVTAESKSDKVVQAVANGPVARQRDVRENGDFMRVAVLEMAMRRNGKLEAHKPGHARWVLPPRQGGDRAYPVGPDGVPLRWRSVMMEE